MAAPNVLRTPDGKTARRDLTRVLVSLAEATRAGVPVLTPATRARLLAIGLVVEGDAGPGGDVRSLSAFNHGPRLLWLRAVRTSATLGDAKTIAAALGRKLAWVSPVYRLANVKGQGAYFSAYPNVLLLRAGAHNADVVDTLTARFRLRPNFDKCRFPGGWRYLEVPANSPADAFDLLAECRKMPKGPEADLEYVPLQAPWLMTPDDTYFPEQHWLPRIGAPQAWDLARGDRRVIVAVIDSGCDLAHPDLVAAYVGVGRNAADAAADGSPVVLAASGALVWHGTAVAGVIAAGLNNSLGVSGLAGGCGLYPVAIPSGSTVEFADAIMYAVESGAQIINRSGHIGEVWFSMARPVIDAAVARGVLFFGAAGNYSDSRLVFPARYPAFVACGGSGNDDRRWQVPERGFGSGYGDELYGGVPTGVSVVAPAEDVATTDISGTPGFMAGTGAYGDYLRSSPGIPSPFNATSAATPMVAGAAALVMSAYADMTGAEVRRLIERTAEKVGGYAYADVAGYPSGTRHPEMGYGRLNVFRALDLGDVMIADWSGDTGVEPSAPPDGNFFSRSDITIRPVGDDLFDPGSDASSELVRRAAHSVSVRVKNAGPATARGVRVDVRATPFVGLEFLYPDDWMGEDALHVRPAAADATPFSLARGESRVVRFELSATQSNLVAGWGERSWHPCLLAVATADNDYAFAGVPGGRAMVTRRNNLAQRNLSVVDIAERRSIGFPFVIGHPGNLDRRLEVVIDAGPLAREGRLFLVPGDDGKAFPAARRAQAFEAGALKTGRVAGGTVRTLDGRMAVQIESGRAVVEVVCPRPGRYVMQLVAQLPAKVQKPRRFLINVAQRVAGRGVTGGATVVFKE